VLHIIWEFRVRADRGREFEEHYGSAGTWVDFFRTGPGFLETRLLRDGEDPSRYLTIDVWTDLESYRAFSEKNAAQYGAIDRRFEALTEQERCLGYFEALSREPAR